jgi:hypothetical protein
MQSSSNDRISLRARLFVVLVCIASATFYLLVRTDSLDALAQFPGVCGRLQAAGLQLRSQDWFCGSETLLWRVSSSAAALLLGIGYVLPCAILASTGRRLTASLPLLVGLALGSAGDLIGLPLMPDQGTLAKLLSLVLLIAPIVAIASFFRRQPRASAHPFAQLGIVSALICAAATWAVVASTTWMFSLHFGLSGGTISPWKPALAIGVFGFLLGFDRRWWPWSLAPVALLLSAGPSLSLLAGPEGLVNWSQFGLAVPLALVGLIWCAWAPLVNWLSVKVERAEGVERVVSGVTTTPDRSPRRMRLRPVVVLNALGAGFLAVSVVVFASDPLPAARSAALPTYLGLRVAASDIRTKMDLRMAIAALDIYAARHGDYSGFDAKEGAALDPSLDWRDGLGLGSSGAIPELTMAIVSDSAARVRIAALSEGGEAFCIERVPDGITYGRSDPHVGPVGPRTRLLKEAVANCGTIPWTASAVRVPDTSDMCQGLDFYGGYVTCRMVQASVATTLRQTKLD